MSPRFRIVGFSRIATGSSKKNGTRRLFQYAANANIANTTPAARTTFSASPAEEGLGGTVTDIWSLHTRSGTPGSQKWKRLAAFLQRHEYPLAHVRSGAPHSESQKERRS